MDQFGQHLAEPGGGSGGVGAREAFGDMPAVRQGLGDGRADFVGHDVDLDNKVDYADYDTDSDGAFDKRMYDDDNDGWLDRTVRRRHRS